MHPRNIFKSGVKFSELGEKYDFFLPFVIKDETTAKCMINFDDRDALRALNKAILMEYYSLDVKIPEHCLIPRIPLRVNYILWLEDLLLLSRHGDGDEQKQVIGLDIGTGPCAIYALLAARMNSWIMYGTDINPESVACALENVRKNSLQEQVKVLQVNSGSFFKEVHEKADSSFDFSMCNPPFFSDGKDSLLKSGQLATPWEEKSSVPEEIICEGGEVNFIMEMIKESRDHQVVRIFTTMVGVKKHLTAVLKYLKEIGVPNFTTTTFHQGRTSRWGLAWTWDKSLQFERAVTKPKKPAQFEAVFPNIPSYTDFQSQILQALKDLEMSLEKINRDTHKVKAERNTWSHARRKRRMQLRASGQENTKAEEAQVSSPPVPSTKQAADDTVAVHPKMPKMDSHDNGNGLESVSSRSGLTTSSPALDQGQVLERQEASFSSSPSSSSPTTTSTLPAIPSSSTGSSSAPPAQVECGLTFKLSTCREACDVIVRLQYITGSLGADGVHQVLQYLKNHFAKQH